jgi:anti-sigma regulatory factor (Ser/Thr protein kinase)
MGRSSSLRLPADLGSASRARAFVEQTLSGHVDDLAAVVLMTSELVMNVALHAHTAVTVTVHEGPPVRVEVHDGVAATDAFREIVTVGGSIPDASAVSGRGLHLVRAMSTRVGLDDDSDGGKVVWFELDPDPPASRK